MARRPGSLLLDAAVEPIFASSLDARQFVRTKEELLSEGSYEYGFNGLIVSVRDEQKLYMLIDKDNPTLEASWKEIGSGGAGGPVDWSDVQNKPTFATVATSGSYNDLSDQPMIPEAYDDTALAARVTAVENGKANTADLAPVATSGSYNDLGDKPTIPEAYDDTAIQAALAGKANTADLANVATSGSYNDLGDKPTIPEAYDDTALVGRVTAVETALPGKADSSSLATVATSGDYDDLTNKPTIPEAYDDTALSARVTALEGRIDADTQADWNETDTTSPAFIQNKPTIPTPITIDSAMSDTSENPVQNKVVLAAIGDAVDVVDTAVQGLDTRVTAVETALNLTALTDEEIAALVPA